ncbi:MAG: Holliday junction branch migration protein RuvA, partial [FCB group bacterium]|nr:Holliday junction branch migration protein RuvA [FCB group bacterium]
VANKGVSHIDLDVGGVGYEVWVSSNVLRKVVTEQTVTLLTHCHIREEIFQIFGFLREEEKLLFRMLLGISGIGPKLALAILSALSVTQFAQAIRENDVTALTRISGLGKKTAQRIVLEMKAKLGQDAELSAILDEPIAVIDENDDVLAALCALGCTIGEARKLATKARAELGNGASDEDVVKKALSSIARVTR